MAWAELWRNIIIESDGPFCFSITVEKCAPVMLILKGSNWYLGDQWIATGKLDAWRVLGRAVPTLFKMIEEQGVIRKMGDV